MINDWTFDFIMDFKGSDDESEEVSFFFSGLKDLPGEANKHLWWLQENSGGDPVFYSTEEAFNKAYERDWCDYSWEELEDDMLKEWLNRLCI